MADAVLCDFQVVFAWQGIHLWHCGWLSQRNLVLSGFTNDRMSGLGNGSLSFFLTWCMLAKSVAVRQVEFFLAHAVHARGSDGHQNVLSLISYSHIVREQVKSKKPGVFQRQNKTNPNTNTTKNNTTKKTPRKLGETLRFQKRKSSCRSVLLHDDIAIPTNICPK